MTGPSSGEAHFDGLSHGSHALRVDIRATRPGGGVRAVHDVEVVPVDVVVFAATPGGIAAAIAAARSGRSVAIIEPTRWVGGMVSGGLAFSDVGWRGREIIGGWAREFFDRVRAAEAARRGCPDPQCFDRHEFQPHLAERTFEDMLAEWPIVVERGVDCTASAKTARRSGPSRRAEVKSRLWSSSTRATKVTLWPTRA